MMGADITNQRKTCTVGNQKALFGTRLARRIEKTEIRKLKTENFFITLQVRTIMN